jgi:hypothetical protein
MAYDAPYWRDELHRYTENYRRFVESGKKIVKRYRDDRKSSENTDARFNILWSNIKTLKPAIYSRPPKIEVSRRNKDQNDAGRVAAIILERVIDFELSQYQDYHYSLGYAVDDRLLVGRGVAWIRYEPTIEAAEGAPLTDDVPDSEQNQMERITNERTPVDYVFWEDFAHLPARTWDEVTWVARRVYLSQEEGIDRFGDDFADVPLTHSPDEDGVQKGSTESLKKAPVWEIWCKSSKTVYWVAEGHDSILDEKADPLEIEGFFPCPKPIFATVTTDSLIPVADFRLYQDQANEIDEITGRIQHLTKALKVMGIYAADEPTLARLMKEGQDAVMVPVTNWPAFVEKGGLQGAVQFMPLGDLMATLSQLYAARDACKQIVYEVTGISDILRGASMAQETATAQQIKSQFASIRLNDMKDDVARFARDLLRMKAEIICSKYQPEMILTISGIANTPDAQFAPQAIALLKDEPMRNYQIDIQTDTLVELDEQAEKQSRVEFMTATSAFLERAVQAAQIAPEITPITMQMLLFGIRGFKVGRSLEGVFEQAVQALTDKAQQPQQPQQPPPDPAIMKAQAEMQMRQQEMQMEAQAAQAKTEFETQKAIAELNAQNQRHQAEIESKIEIERIKQEYETQRSRERIDADIQIARINADAATQQSVAADICETAEHMEQDANLYNQMPVM